MLSYIPLFISLTFDNNLANRLIWVKFRINIRLFMHGVTRTTVYDTQANASVDISRYVCSRCIV